MRLIQVVSCFLSLLLLFAPFGPPLAANPSPQSAAPDAQAAALAQQSLSVLAGTTTISDVTLSGTTRRIAGSDDETGTAVLKALATGESRVDLSFPSGQRSEVRANSPTGQVGNWFGPDGLPHPLSWHNLMTASSWFFPAFTSANLSSPQLYALSYVGHETRNGQAVEHLTASAQTGGLPANTAAMIQHLSQIDLYLDSTTFLPAALLFNTHPDDDAGLDITVEIRLSDYRAVSGAQVPFHVQRFLNNGLVLDLQLQTVTLNTGLTAAAFTVQ